MKRLLICSSTFPLGPNDRRTARFVYDLAAALARHFDVAALAPHHPGAARTERMGPVAVRRFRYFPPASAQRLADGAGIMANVRRSPLARLQAPALLGAFRHAAARELRRRHYDVVNSHWLVPAGWAAAAAARRTGARHLLTIHAADVFLLRRLALGRRVARGIIQSADAVFCDSAFIIEETSRLVGFDVEAQATTAGVDAKTFAPRFSPAKAKEKLGWSAVPTVLFVGRLVEKKGLPYLIRAMARLAREIPAVRLVAAGEGPARAGAEKLVRELGLTPRVAFIGARSHDELRLMYNAADVLAVPSIVARDGETEGMPTVILEAFAAACPVVGSAVAGIPEFVRDGQTGFLTTAADDADLAAALKKALDTGREAFGDNCLAAAAKCDFTELAALYAAAAEG